MDFITNEGCWRQHKKPLNQGNGTRTNFVCIHCKTRGAKCAQRLFTLHNMGLDNTVYHLYRTEAALNHVELGNEPTAITDDVKKLIREFVDANTT